MLADLIFILHAAVVLFNAGGLLLILIGAPLNWSWIRNRKFRITHVAMMTFVSLEAILGVSCPLTVLEDWLRGVSGQQSFVQRWAGALIYWDAPPWSDRVRAEKFITTCRQMAEEGTGARGLMTVVHNS